MKNQHMTIFYNISIPAFLVDCQFSAKPTKFAKGWEKFFESRQKPPTDKNPQVYQKLPTVGKIL
jgi:hypothetical protein